MNRKVDRKDALIVGASLGVFSGLSVKPVKDVQGQFALLDDAGNVVATVHSAATVGGAELGPLQLAILFSAAPELLAAASECRDWLYGLGAMSWERKLSPAIKKATRNGQS